MPPIMKRYYRQFDLHLVRRVWANLLYVDLLGELKGPVGFIRRSFASP